MKAVLQHCADGDFTPPGEQAPDRDIPVELEAITLKAMARRREDRYGSVTELIADIRRYRDFEPVAAYSSKPFYRLLKAYQRRPMIPFGILTGFIAVLAAALILMAVNSWRGTPLRAVAEEHIAAGNTALERAVDMIADRRKNLQGEGQADYEATRKMQSAIRGFREEAESNYGVALDLLSRLEGTNGNAAWIDAKRADIYEHLLEFLLDSGKFQEVRDTTTRLEDRHSAVLAHLAVNAPELLARAKAVTAGLFMLTAEAEGDEINLYTMPLDGSGQATSAAGTGLQLQLPAGGYVAEVLAADGRKAFFPFNAAPGSRLDLKLELPTTIPAGTVYVPPGGIQNRLGGG